jgi:hypothetical protein
LKAYIDRIANLYQFEPRKKYVEELEDTSESDATDDDDDDSDEIDLETGSGIVQQMEDSRWRKPELLKNLSVG